MGYLETVEVDDGLHAARPFRLPVQWVNRPNLDFRGFAGTIAGGVVRPGDRIRVQPSGRESTVARIVTPTAICHWPWPGQSVTLTLADEIDISRGDVISTVARAGRSGRPVRGTIVWMHDEPLLPGRPYLLKIGTRTVTATVTDIKYKVNVNTLEHLAAKKLELNEIGVCNLSLDRRSRSIRTRINRDTGGFILIDRLTNHRRRRHAALRAAPRAQHPPAARGCGQARARRAEGTRSGCVLWFTGLSGAGKSTIANLVEKKLHALGRHTYLLDGDNVRHGLNKDLGFTDADRVENIRRVAEVAKLMVDAGLIVLTAFISPFRSERRMARGLVEDGEFIEIFVDTPLEVAEARDPRACTRRPGAAS
jgi:bifunctional enzyme CysN/CysC